MENGSFRWFPLQEENNRTFFKQADFDLEQDEQKNHKKTRKETKSLFEMDSFYLQVMI